MKTFVGVISAIALLGAAVYGWRVRAVPEPTATLTFELKKSDFIRKITEAGELRAMESVTISAQRDLPIIYLVLEGTFVKPGDVLVRFDPTKYELALEESKARLDVVRADLRKAEKDLEAQREKLLAELSRFEAEIRIAELELGELRKKPLPDELERVRLELDKAKLGLENAQSRRDVLPALVSKGFVTKSTLDEAAVKYLEAKAALQVAQANLDQVSAGATPVELEKARIRLDEAKGALEKGRRGVKAQLQSFQAAVEREKANLERTKSLIEIAQGKLNEMELRAPRSGLVVYAKGSSGKATERIQLGMIPFAGQSILYLPDVSTMVVDAEINEIDIGKVKVGGPVDVRLEAYPGAVFRGRVLKISSLAKLKQSRPETVSGIKVFDVTVRIEENDPRLKPGLTASLDIIVDRREGVLSVPVSAVLSQKGEHSVFVSNAGKIEERKVILGTSNDQSVIVERGLRPGEHVLLGPPPGPV